MIEAEKLFTVHQHNLLEEDEERSADPKPPLFRDQDVINIPLFAGNAFGQLPRYSHTPHKGKMPDQPGHETGNPPTPLCSRFLDPSLRDTPGSAFLQEEESSGKVHHRVQWNAGTRPGDVGRCCRVGGEKLVDLFGREGMAEQVEIKQDFEDIPLKRGTGRDGWWSIWVRCYDHGDSVGGE